MGEPSGIVSLIVYEGVDGVEEAMEDSARETLDVKFIKMRFAI